VIVHASHNAACVSSLHASLGNSAYPLHALGANPVAGPAGVLSLQLNEIENTGSLYFSANGDPRHTDLYAVSCQEKR
jgi:hypothetical protein